MSYYQTTAMRKSKRVLCTYVAACKQCPHTPCNFAHTIEDLMDSNNDTFKTMPCKNDDRRSNNRCMYSHSCSFGHYDSDGKMREVQYFHICRITFHLIHIHSLMVHQKSYCV